MGTILTIKCDDLVGADLQDLTESLCQTLNREGVEASLAKQPAERGMKTPDPIAIGKIALALVGSGGMIVTLINVLNTYIGRVNHLEIEISNQKGEAIKLKGDNLRSDQLIQTTRFIRKFLGAEK